jgi:hypothetical protein
VDHLQALKPERVLQKKKEEDTSKNPKDICLWCDTPS